MQMTSPLIQRDSSCLLFFYVWKRGDLFLIVASNKFNILHINHTEFRINFIANGQNYYQPEGVLKMSKKKKLMLIKYNAASCIKI